ncbi:hypothetical protein UlMin_005259 [Ulmus minor]
MNVICELRLSKYNVLSHKTCAVYLACYSTLLINSHQQLVGHIIAVKIISYNNNHTFQSSSVYKFLSPIIAFLNLGFIYPILYNLMPLKLKRQEILLPLNILCHSFLDIDTYTTGFPRWPRSRKNIFRANIYSLILTASKEQPKHCIMYGSKTAKYTSRKNVGIRMPDDEICQAIVEKIDAPLISTSVKSLKENDWMLDPVATGDSYGPEFGLGFPIVVDNGFEISNVKGKEKKMIIVLDYIFGFVTLDSPLTLKIPKLPFDFSIKNN